MQELSNNLDQISMEMEMKTMTITKVIKFLKNVKNIRLMPTKLVLTGPK